LIDPVRFLALSAWLLACLFAPPADSSSFSANPVRITLSAGTSSAALTLENKGDQPVLVQAEVMAWSQQNGKDLLVPSRDLIVSPPIFKMAVGAAQIVRVGLQVTLSDLGREVTYRLFLQEVPPPPPPGQQGVSVALRLGIPVFVLPRGKVLPQPQWRVARADGGQIKLSLVNSGNAHIQAIDCRLYRADGTLIAEQQLNAYVLAGQAQSWQIKPSQPWRGEKLKLAARTDAGDVTVQIDPE
jgi:fimbrial chaperone protein